MSKEENWAPWFFAAAFFAIAVLMTILWVVVGAENAKLKAELNKCQTMQEITTTVIRSLAE